MSRAWYYNTAAVQSAIGNTADAARACLDNLYGCFNLFLLLCKKLLLLDKNFS